MHIISIALFLFGGAANFKYLTNINEQLRVSVDPALSLGPYCSNCCNQTTVVPANYTGFFSYVNLVSSLGCLCGFGPVGFRGAEVTDAQYNFSATYRAFLCLPYFGAEENHTKLRSATETAAAAGADRAGDVAGVPPALCRDPHPQLYEGTCSSANGDVSVTASTEYDRSMGPGGQRVGSAFNCLCPLSTPCVVFDVDVPGFVCHAGPCNPIVTWMDCTTHDFGIITLDLPSGQLTQFAVILLQRNRMGNQTETRSLPFT